MMDFFTRIVEAVKRFFGQWLKMMNPPVFFGAGLIVVGFIIFGTTWTSLAKSFFESLLSTITSIFGWYYIIIVFVFLVFVVWLYFSPYGKIRLGPDNSKPEFSKIGWISMLFAAGMGMGLIFWGVAEPIKHYTNPAKASPESLAAIKEAMQYSFFHWGLHPWAIYIIFALGVAYFHFRKELPLAPRSLFFPLLGEKIYGWAGHFIDIFCTVGTLLGVATSLGLGAMQINSGLSDLTAIQNSIDSQVWIIVIITAAAVTSTISGVGKGIKYLSLANVGLMLLFLVFVLITGPTLYVVEIFTSTLGRYLQDIVSNSLWIDLRPSVEWQSNWTIFYWGWWLSWCPFVGIFVARVSKGRTIKEFIFYVLIVPVLVTFLWFSALGGTAIDLVRNAGADLVPVIQDDVSGSLNALLGYLPFSGITRWLGVLLVVIFFITSSDSGSLVDDMVTSGGHPNPPVVQRAFWGIAEGAAAATLLISGGLTALQTASITAGFPQSLIVLGCLISLVRALRQERK